MKSSAQQLQSCLDDGAAGGIPGISAAIAGEKGLIWNGIAGLADLRSEQPINAAMTFGIGSITKTFVAVIILQLVEEGRLRLDDQAGALLGPVVDRIANGASATVAQLLGHRSGIPSWEWVPAWIRAGRGADLLSDHIWGKAETLPYIFGRPAIAPPGDAAEYSNSNYTLLGLIVEQLTGRDLVEEIHMRILDPLDLKTIALEGFEAARSGPRRYHWATDQFRAEAGIHPAFPEVRPGLIDVSASNLSVEWAAGGLVATAADLARFGAALRSGKLLSAASMAAMQRWDAMISEREFGLGLYSQLRPDGVRLIGHEGGVLGFEATMFWMDDLDLVVAVLGNAGLMHSGEVSARLLHLTRDDRFLDAVRALAASRS